MNVLINKKTETRDLGNIAYKAAWEYQEALFKDIVDVKVSNRKLAPEDHQPTNNYLLFCEHPHVYTLGKSGNETHLLLAEDRLKSINATYYKINRGGDITYHGPGQIVCYPLLDLENFFTDIHRYLRTLEEAVIQTLGEFGIEAGRYPGYTGVWLDADNDKARKICAMGVKSSRWVTMHGLAFNVNTDLSYFGHIVPCGIEDKAVTSLEKELGEKVDMPKVQQLLEGKIRSLFDMVPVGLVKEE